MTWIRWDTRTPYHKVVGALAEALAVSPATALGHYTAVCCNLGEYQADGRLAAITDTTLETWALWTGKAGRFAAVFRQTCIEDQPDQDDEVGVVRGWWRQRALLEKQERDAAKRKPAKNPRRTRAEPAENPRTDSENPRATKNDDDDVDGNELQASSFAGPAADPVSELEFVHRCVAAVNAGLRANERVCATGQPRELISSNERHIAIEWHRAGFPIEVVEQAIYARSLGYVPKHTRRQPHGLSYFRQAVAEAVERQASRSAERPIDIPGPERRADDVDWGELARQERERQEAGAGS